MKWIVRPIARVALLLRELSERAPILMIENATLRLAIWEQKQRVAIGCHKISQLKHALDIATRDRKKTHRETARLARCLDDARADRDRAQLQRREMHEEKNRAHAESEARMRLLHLQLLETSIERDRLALANARLAGGLAEDAAQILELQHRLETTQAALVSFSEEQNDTRALMAEAADTIDQYGSTDEKQRLVLTRHLFGKAGR